MKQKNFRIIELPEHQVLIMRDFDEDEENSPQIKIMFFVEGVKISFTITFKEANGESVDKVFEEFSEEKAQKYVNESLKIVTP